MTTHGRGPVSRFFLGSVADELLRRSPVPLLLTRSHERAPALIPEPVLRNVLIPLDGSALAEQVLGPALDLARLMASRCTLLRVVEAGPPPHGRTEQAVAEAGAYLEHLAGWVREPALPVEARVVVAPHAAAAIIQEAQAQGSDLIALATHGRGGVRRMLLGSVADKVIRATTTPVLVYRPPAG
jgi:nucleotide-binding universal stress UspA family protein